MTEYTVMGIDTAKNYIQIHAATDKGKMVFKKRLTREKFLPFMANKPKCLVGMEACGGSHYWARALTQLGFDVKLMSPQKVKKYTDYQKNDERDAQACAEAVGRAQMLFVPIKTKTQMEIQAIHRVRSYYVRQQTGLMNMTRGLLLELGIAVAKGKSILLKRLSRLLDADEPTLEGKNKALFQGLYDDLKQVNEKIKGYTAQLNALAEDDPACQRIQTLDGMGPISASALIAKIGNGSEFKKGRDLAAYLGLVPKQHSSGDTQRLQGISKHGDRYIRQLLIHGGRSAIQAANRRNKLTGAYCKQDVHSQWIRQLAARIGVNKASVAVANKNARMVMALLKNNTIFEAKLAHS